jgi:hypothetical protein
LNNGEAYAARLEIAQRAVSDQKFPDETFTDQKRCFGGQLAVAELQTRKSD